MKTENQNPYFEVKIIKHTQLQFAHGKTDGWYVDSVGKTIRVREVMWPSAYYECESGDSILKSDTQKV